MKKILSSMSKRAPRLGPHLLISFSFILLLAGCGGDNNQPVVSITITANPTTVVVGNPVTIKVTTQNTTINWTKIPADFTKPVASSTTGTVTQTWTPTTAGDYEFTVAASANSSKRDTVMVHVLPISISLVDLPEIIAVGEEITITVDAQGTDITWTAYPAGFVPPAQTTGKVSQTWTPTEKRDYTFTVTAAVDPAKTDTITMRAVVFTSFDVDIPGATSTMPLGLNDSNLITGTYIDNANTAHGFKCDTTGCSGIDFPKAATSYIYKVNNNEHTVGVGWQDANPLRSSYGFLRDASGNLRPMNQHPGSIIGTSGTTAYGLSDSGLVVGNFREENTGVGRGYLYDNDTYTTLEKHADATGDSSYFMDINDSKQIVGYFSTAEQVNQSFLYDGNSSGGSPYTIIDCQNIDNAQASGINNNGQVVGQYSDASSAIHGFMYDAGVCKAFNYPGAESTSPTEINNNGLVVGFYRKADGVAHGFTMDGLIQ